jgi:hypothetical protein
MFAFREFGDVLGAPSEILVLGTKDRIETHGSWEIDSALLERRLASDELLFVYGTLEGSTAGARGSVCIDEADKKASITISLPEENLARGECEIGHMCQLLCSELLTLSFPSTVIAGWEVELPETARSAREILQTAFIQTPKIEWLATSFAESSGIPGFQESAAKDGVVVFRRKATVAGH